MKRGTEMKKMPRGGWFGCFLTSVIEAGKVQRRKECRAYKCEASMWAWV